ncbi:Cytochrome c oxidase subunit 4 [Sorochytrium milnesiophthora]
MSLAARLTRSLRVLPALRSPSALRALSSSAVRLGGGHAEPFVGPGAKAGTVPSDMEQSTGLERFEYLGALEGRDVFDMKPLEMTHMGTPKNPIVVKSVEDVRYVGCTGFPADSHDTLWLRVSDTKGVDRCSECGCCYQLKVVDHL